MSRLRAPNTGIFCTHLHPLLDLPLSVQRVRRYQMEVSEVRDDVGRTSVRPTMRLIPGESRHTLAFTTARKCGVDEEIVSRAEELLDQIDVTASASRMLVPSQSLPTSSSSPKNLSAAGELKFNVRRTPRRDKRVALKKASTLLT